MQNRGGEVPRPLRRNLRRALAVVATAVVLPAGVFLGTQSAKADAPVPTITPVARIGNTINGHAYLYGWGAAVLNNGNVLIGDYWNFQIREFSPTGQDLGIFGATTASGGFSPASQGTGFGFHQSPYGIAVSPTTGDVYVGDVDNGSRVDEYDSNGNFITSWGSTGTGTGHFNYPARIAVSPDGSYLAVSDQRLNQLIFDDPNGNELFRVGTKGSALGQLSAPRGLAFAPNGQLYVADGFNDRVVVYNVNVAAKTATAVAQFGSGGTNPGQFAKTGDLRGVAIDPSHGWIYVSDAAGGYVDKFNLAAPYAYVSRVGGYGNKPGLFSAGPREVAVDQSDNLWVGDLPDFSVQQFTPSGTVIQVIPTPAQPPAPGGFNSPLDVATDGAGNMYVDDEHNQRIQELNSSGTYILQWGSRGSANTKFNYPRGVTVVPATAVVCTNPQTDTTGPATSGVDNVVVADTDNDQMKEYTVNQTTHVVTWIWTVGKYGAGVNEFYDPHTVTAAADGSFWVADTQNWRIVHLDPCGRWLSLGTFGTHGSGQTQFQYPRDVGVDPVDGSLWVPDSLLGVVKHFSTSGTYLGQFGSLGTGVNQFDQVERVLVDSNYVYVSDADGNQVTVWDRSSMDFLTNFGGPGTKPGQMYQPHGMAFLPGTHDLLVVDQSNAWIDVFATQAVQPPVANPDSATGLTGTAVGIPVLANDTDPNGSPITITSYTQPANGTSTCVTGSTTGTCTYTSNAGFSGSDSFQYTITDGLGQTATGTVTITVNAPQPPVANPDSATTFTGTPVSIPVMANDTDPNGSPITITSYTQPANGTSTCVTGSTTGTCSYTSTPNYTGSDSFQYTITDGLGQTATGTVSITVNRPTQQTVAVWTPTGGQTVSIPVSITGLCTDPTAVSKVGISIKDRVTGLYAQANGTWSSTFYKFAAVLATPGDLSSTWSLSWTPGSGGSASYAMQVSATDLSGVTTSKLTINFKTS